MKDKHRPKQDIHSSKGSSKGSREAKPIQMDGILLDLIKNKGCETEAVVLKEAELQPGEDIEKLAKETDDCLQLDYAAARGELPICVETTTVTPAAGPSERMDTVTAEPENTMVPSRQDPPQTEVSEGVSGEDEEFESTSEQGSASDEEEEVCQPGANEESTPWDYPPEEERNYAFDMDRVMDFFEQEFRVHIDDDQGNWLNEFYRDVFALFGKDWDSMSVYGDEGERLNLFVQGAMAGWKLRTDLREIEEKRKWSHMIDQQRRILQIVTGVDRTLENLVSTINDQQSEISELRKGLIKKETLANPVSASSSLVPPPSINMTLQNKLSMREFLLVNKIPLDPSCKSLVLSLDNTPILTAQNASSLQESINGILTRKCQNKLMRDDLAEIFHKCHVRVNY